MAGLFAIPLIEDRRPQREIAVAFRQADVPSMTRTLLMHFERGFESGAFHGRFQLLSS
jgi:hypothetical protein